MIPASLIKHVSHKIKTALLPTGWSTTEIDALAQSLMNQLINDPEVGQSKKLAFETGEKLSKALALDASKKPYKALEKENFKSLLYGYDRHLKANQVVFENISGHHDTITNESWTDVAANSSSLAVYADAANVMGSKIWVAECNKWFETFSVSYFRNGGARKHYLRQLQKAQTSTDIDQAFIASLSKDLMQTDGTARRIRLLDVGSCYNPLAKGEHASQLEVTALDLYPVDPSVLQCDFLNLEIGAEGSAPTIVDASAAIHEDEHSAKRQKVDPADQSQSPAPQSKRLLRLPAASHDVVTMSLVLNYLPTPEQRQRMIQQARSLLVSPPSSDSLTPHRNGLLLIAEKQSIFKAPNPQHQSKAAKQQQTSDPTETPMAGETSVDDWSNWVNCISSCGFELVRYQNYHSSDGRKSHLFAFCTVPLGTAAPAGDAATDSTECKMWIKQDRERALQLQLQGSRLGAVETILA